MNKGTLTPSLEATLKETDVNYLTAVAPGDFVFVNMLNWESDARDVAIRANNGDPINGPNDGFKGLFKVQSVRKSIAVSEADGKKLVFYKIDGYGFTEFNNTIYFNQNLLASGSQDNFGLFIRRLSQDWANLVNPQGFFNIQKIISILITSFIGNGINTSDLSDDFKSNLTYSQHAISCPISSRKSHGVYHKLLPQKTSTTICLAFKPIRQIQIKHWHKVLTLYFKAVSKVQVSITPKLQFMAIPSLCQNSGTLPRLGLSLTNT